MIFVGANAASGSGAVWEVCGEIMIDTSQVSIVIPHLGQTSEQEYALDQCLQSLKETFSGKILVVANGRKTCNHEWNIHIADQGQCKAVNAAAATVNTPWIFVTNDDMVYAPNWFEKLTKPINLQMESSVPSYEIKCISPKLIEPRAGAPTFEVYFCGGAGGDFDKVKWLEFVSNYKGQGLRTGFNLPFLIKKELWDLISGYDVAYDPWGSNGDSDLQAKIHLAGIQPYQNTNAIVYHFAETSGTSSPENRPYWQKNWDYFISKFGFERQSSPMVWESVDIINYNKLKYKPFWMNHYAIT